MGYYLELAKKVIVRLPQAEAQPSGGTRVRESQPEPPAVPSDERHHRTPATAVLLAPRYYGDSKPLASVPTCWCCKAPWELDKLTERKGKTYAWLKPGCACLDVPQALGCCCLCVEHCRCTRPGGEENGER